MMSAQVQQQASAATYLEVAGLDAGRMPKAWSAQ